MHSHIVVVLNDAVGMGFPPDQPMFVTSYQKVRLSPGMS